MSKKVSKLINNTKVWTQKHSPEILIGIGVTGMITTTLLAVKATPRALDLIALEKEELKVDKLTTVETIRATWKLYSGYGFVCGICLLHYRRQLS